MTPSMIPYQGRLWPLQKLAAHARLPYPTFWNRLYNLGWDVDRAVKTPVDLAKSHHGRRRRNEAF